jgi:hypothetical protein
VNGIEVALAEWGVADRRVTLAFANLCYVLAAERKSLASAQRATYYGVVVTIVPSLFARPPEFVP